MKRIKGFMIIGFIAVVYFIVARGSLLALTWALTGFFYGIVAMPFMIREWYNFCFRKTLMKK